MIVVVVGVAFLYAGIEGVDQQERPDIISVVDAAHGLICDA